MVLLLTGKVITELGFRNSPTKFFHVFVKQLHDLPKISGRVHEGNMHQGDDWHGVGSVKNWTITIEGEKETVKESIEVIDEQNKSVTFNIFEGEISKNYKFLRVNMQVIDKGDAGGIVKWTFDYEKLNEDIPPPYRYLDHVTVLTKDVDAHILKAQQ